MPRIARMYSELKVYHIIIRGIDKQDIFLDTYDKDKFLKIIRDTKEKYNYKLNIIKVDNFNEAVDYLRNN